MFFNNVTACVFVSNVNILYKPIPIHFGESVLIFVQPRSGRE